MSLGILIITIKIMQVKFIKKYIIWFVIVILTFSFIILYELNSMLKINSFPSNNYIDKDYFYNHLSEYDEIAENILMNKVSCYQSNNYKYHLPCDNPPLDQFLLNKIFDLKITNFYLIDNNLIISVNYSSFWFYEEIFIYNKNIKSIDVNNYGSVLTYINDNWGVIKY